MKKIFTLIAISLVIKVTAQPVTYNWAKGLAGSNQPTGRMDMVRDNSGNLFVTGEFQGTRTFGTFTLTSAGYIDVYVAKFDTSGTCIWAKKGGSPIGGAIAHAGSIALDVTTGNVYITGSFQTQIIFDFITLFATGGYDVFLAKFDYLGNAVFVNPYGGNGNDHSPSIFVHNNEIYITGNFTGSITFGSTTLNAASALDIDIFITRFDLAGTCNWAVKAGGIDPDLGLCIKKDIISNYIYVTGNFSNTATFGSNSVTSTLFSDMYLAKYDLSGNNIWVKKGGGDGNDTGNGLGIDQNGNVVVTGSIGDTAWFDGYVLYDNTNGNMFVAKYNLLGVCQWAKGGGGTVNDGGVDVAIRPDGYVFVTGSFNSTANFSGITLVSNGASDAFILAYMPYGSIAFASKIGGTGFDGGTGIEFDGNILYAIGEFSGTVTMGSSSVTSPLGVSGTYLTKINGGTVGMDEINNVENSLDIFPNPVKDYLTVTIPSNFQSDFEIEILTIEGKTLLKQDFDKTVTGNIQFKTDFLSSGNYFIKLKAEGSEYFSKFVVE